MTKRKFLVYLRFLLFKTRNEMDAHIRDKKLPTKSAAEIHKWASNVDMMAASHLYNVNILVHDLSNSYHAGHNWRIYNLEDNHQLFKSKQLPGAPSLFIDFVNRTFKPFLVLRLSNSVNCYTCVMCLSDCVMCLSECPLI